MGVPLVIRRAPTKGVGVVLGYRGCLAALLSASVIKKIVLNTQ